jgi:glycosyltransferase involved in cell wall biosynthesis
MMESPATCERIAVTSGVASHRIGYDARFSIGEYRGMGRYLRRLIRSVEATSIGFCATGEFDKGLQLSAGGLRPFPLWEQISLPRRAVESGIEFLLAPYNTAPLRLAPGIKLILVVHDLIYLRSTSDLPLSRSAYQNFGRLYRRWNVPHAVHRAHRIVCVSEYTRRELLRRFPVDESKISVIPNTIETSWFALERSPVPNDYILCVSGEAPNKNLPRALQGFAEYCRISRDRATQLEVVGVKAAHHTAFINIAKRHGVSERVRFHGYVSDAQLQSLYSSARALFYPSSDEGFGIPVLEALAAGLPVVASNASSIPEVGGEAALYFHSDSVSQMAEQLRSVLSNPHLQHTMSHRGRQRALQFHPDAVDSQICEFWKQTLGGR